MGGPARAYPTHGGFVLIRRANPRQRWPANHRARAKPRSMSARGPPVLLPAMRLLTALRVVGPIGPLPLKPGSGNFGRSVLAVPPGDCEQQAAGREALDFGRYGPCSCWTRASPLPRFWEIETWIKHSDQNTGRDRGAVEMALLLLSLSLSLNQLLRVIDYSLDGPWNRFETSLTPP